MAPGGRTAERIFGLDPGPACQSAPNLSSRNAGYYGPEAAGITASTAGTERGRRSAAESVRRLKSSSDVAGLASQKIERHEDGQRRPLSPGLLSPRHLDTADRIFCAGGSVLHGGDGRAGSPLPLRMLSSRDGTGEVQCWLNSPEPGDEAVRTARAEDRAGTAPSHLWGMKPKPESARTKEQPENVASLMITPRAKPRSPERAATPRGMPPSERGQTPRRTDGNAHVLKSPRLAHAASLQGRSGTGVTWNNNIVLSPRAGRYPEQHYRSSSPLRPGVPGLQPETEARFLRAPGDCSPSRIRSNVSPYAYVTMPSKGRPSVRL